MQLFRRMLVLLCLFSMHTLRAQAQSVPSALPEYFTVLSGTQTTPAPSTTHAPAMSAPAMSAPAEERFPKINVGGLLQLDAGMFNQSVANEELFGNIRDGATFRSARLWARGELLRGASYMIEMDFGALASASPGRPNFQNAFLEFEGPPELGNLRLGRWKQPFNLETATSIRFLTFIERANIFAFVPFRRTGIGLQNWSADERWTWAASVFRASDDGYGGSLANDQGWATAGRLTHLLWCDDACQQLLHLGLAHTYNGAPAGTVRFGRFPEFAVGITPVGGASANTPNFFDTGPIAASSYNVFGGELGWVHGPLSVQGEFHLAVVNALEGPNPLFPSWYLQASYFLTGESRNYLKREGAFGRVTPRENFSMTRAGGVQGWGAWELTARVSHVDVNDAGINGGRLTDLTFGLNWHLNPNAKLQFNYIHAMQSDNSRGENLADIFALRVSYDF
jgi:phosphate-selective porin OprO and OprP